MTHPLVTVPAGLAVQVHPFVPAWGAVRMGNVLLVGQITMERIRWATSPQPTFAPDVDFPRDCPPGPT